MRRIWAAGAAIVMCLALGAPMMAQEASPAADGPILVTATQTCTWDTSGDVLTATCAHSASDPRVTGLLTQTLVEAVGTPDGPYLETLDLTLKGPDGTWTGRGWVAFDWPNDVAYALTILTGEGAYEGWTYVTSVRDIVADANFDGADGVGVLYEGPPPPGITTG